MIKKLCSLFLAIVMILGVTSTTALAADNSEWEYLPDMTFSKIMFGSGYYDNTIYIVGLGTINSKYSLITEKYDLATETWSTGTIYTDYPYYHFASASVENKIYIIGGGNTLLAGGTGTKNVSVYDMAEDIWYNVNNMPTARAYGAAVAVGNEIYVAGGISGSTLFDVVEIYNTETNTWRTGKPMPMKLAGMTGAYHDGKLYFMGGYSDSSRTQLSSIQLIFDIATETWSSGTNMPEAKFASSAVTYENQIYMLGGLGHTQNSEYYNSVHVYNIEQGLWAAMPPMNEKKCFHSSIIVDNKLYSFGGMTNTATLTAEVLDLSIPTPPTPEPSGKELAALLYTGESTKMAITGVNASDIQWSSSDETVATVTSNGMVTAVGEGFAYIQARNDSLDFSGFIPIEIIEGSGPIETTERPTVSLPANTPVRLRLLGAGTTPVTWTSFDPDIATVDENGVVTAVGAGLVIIQAECGGETFYLYVKA